MFIHFLSIILLSSATLIQTGDTLKFGYKPFISTKYINELPKGYSSCSIRMFLTDYDALQKNSLACIEKRALEFESAGVLVSLNADADLRYQLNTYVKDLIAKLANSQKICERTYEQESGRPGCTKILEKTFLCQLQWINIVIIEDSCHITLKHDDKKIVELRGCLAERVIRYFEENKL